MRLWLLIVALIAGSACHKKKAKEVDISPISSTTNSPGVRRAMARAMQSQGNYQEAVQVLRQALKEEGGAGNPETHMLLGVSLRELKFYPEADEELQTSLQLDKKSAEAWNALGVLRQLSDNGDPIQAFREAVHLASDVAEYQNNLGFALYLASQVDEATEVLRRAVTLNPKEPRFRNNLGFALGAAGEYDAAKTSFLAGGTEAQALNNLGVVYERSGDLSNATASYQNAIALDPGLSEAKKNLERLQHTSNP